MNFDWNKIQYREDGKILLLYRHERIFEEGLVKPGDKVLDIGGWGHFTERVMQEGAECFVWDKFTEDQYFTERVRKNKHMQVDICTCHTLAYVHSNVFDLVTCFETLEHVADQKAALINIHTVLRPSGIFAGTVPIPGFCHHLDEPGIQFLNEKELRNLLQETGFIDIFIEPTGSLTKDSPQSSLYFRGVKQ
jgi:SAM-dependent methyltransferase